MFFFRCVRDLLSTGDRKKKRICPDCRKSLNSRLMLICYDELKAAYGDNNATMVAPPPPTFTRFRSTSSLGENQPL